MKDVLKDTSVCPQGLLLSTLVSGWVPTLLRAGRGMTRYDHATDAPAQQLQLYDYDGDHHLAGS